MIPRIALHLLDSAQGHPLQTWTFEGRDSITLGRADDNDIVVADPYVSRAHAYLKFEGHQWRLIAISRQLVFHQGQTWNEVPLAEGMVFRLGEHGCYLRFGQSQNQPVDRTTISFDPTLMPVLQLDREKMKHEVDEIATGDYFQQLKNATRDLRERRQAEETKH